MFKNYLKITFRNLTRHQTFSIINIAGLAIGMACCILILLYVEYELSYDNFHEKAGRIYRVIEHDPRTNGKRNGHFAVTPGQLAPTLIREYPEVTNATRIAATEGDNSLLSYNEVSFYENGIYADDHFFRIFSFPLLSGDAKTALAEPFSMIVSNELAEKLFGNDDPIGKVINYNQQYDVKITGVLKNLPENTHIKFKYIISFSTLASLPETKRLTELWNNSSSYTYIELHEKFTASKFEYKLAAVIDKYIEGEAAESKNQKKKYFLQPLRDIHFGTHISLDISPHNDIRNIYFFTALALIILVVACINYMNLSTARSSKRGKEIGIRKVVGAQRTQLIKQLIGESTFFALISLVFAISIVELSLPSFSLLVNRNLEINFFNNWSFLCILCGIIVFVGVFAGSYPALFLSTFKPVKILKAAPDAGPLGFLLRNIFFVIQFVVSIVFIAVTLIIHNQLFYIKSMETGYSRDHILIVPIQDKEIPEKYKLIRNELMQNPYVINVSASSVLPSDIGSRTNASIVKDDGEITKMPIYYASIDYDFLNVFDIVLSQGRNFSTKFSTDKERGILLNEAAVKSIGWKKPLGQKFPIWPVKEGQVVGVVKDFNFLSLHRKIEPVALWLQPGEINYLSVKLKPENTYETLNFIENTMKKFSANYPFEYYFLDDSFNNMYEEEQKLGSIFGYVSVLAIFIACLGLFGLVSFTIEKRTKEIGIRKALGASITNIVFLFSKEFIKLVIIANIVAWPIAYYAMSTWLQNFEYRIHIGFMIFIVAALYAFAIVILTVGSQTMKIALANPVDSLRYE